jgi:glycosyltransferase involved in cell wall biosynthesis
MSKRLLVIIPAYNEVDSIADVVAGVCACAPQADVVVVDDGSTDATAELAGQAGAMLLRLPVNLGIGGAVQTGYRFAVRQEYEWVARLDGDGQHDPTQIAALLDPILAGRADVVIGSRYLNTGGFYASWARRFGISLFAAIVSLLTGRRFTDVTSGFQAANCEAAAFLAEHCPSDYPEIEGLVLLCRAGFRVVEVPVTMQARTAGRSSIRAWHVLYYVVKVLLAILAAFLRQAPRRTERSQA